MKLPRHGLHGATVAVIGDMVHVPGGGPAPGGIQGAYHDALRWAGSESACTAQKK